MQGSGKLVLYNFSLDKFARSEYYTRPVERNAPTPITIQETIIEADEPLSSYDVYSSIPTEFVTVDTWPKSINLSCIYCGNPIPDVPIPIIVGVDISCTPKRFKVHRLACLPTCMDNYIREVSDPLIECKQNAREYSNMVLRMICDNQIIEAPQGLCRSQICMYAGQSGMSYQYWREQNVKIWRSALLMVASLQ